MHAERAASKASRTLGGEWQVCAGGGQGQDHTPEVMSLLLPMELSGCSVSTGSRKITEQCVEIGKIVAEEGSKK